MKSRFFLVFSRIVATGFILITLQTAFARKPANRPGNAGKNARSKHVKIHEEADQLQYDDKTKQVHFIGHVKLWQEDTYLQADQAVYNMNTRQVEAQGRLFMKNSEGAVTGDHLLLFYDQKHAVVDGRVHLITTVETASGKSPRHPQKEPLNITSGRLDYDWKNHVISADGNVVLIQPGRKVSGDHAVYDEPGQRLTMDGNVHLFRENQDDLACDHLEYNLKTNVALASGRVKGTFLVKREEEIPSVKKPEIKQNSAQPPAAHAAPPPAPAVSPPPAPPANDAPAAAPPPANPTLKEKPQSVPLPCPESPPENPKTPVPCP